MSLPGVSAFKGEYRRRLNLLELLSRGEVRFYDGAKEDGFAVRLRAPATLSADVDLILPGADGIAGQVLVTDGAGSLSFADVSAEIDTSLFQAKSQKDAASGYAGLTAGTKLKIAEMTGVMALSDLTDGSGAELTSHKNAASGYAGLSAGSKLALAQMTGVMASSDLTNDSALEKTANKNAVSGYCGLDAGALVAAARLAASPSASKILRGDQSWVTIPHDMFYYRNVGTSRYEAWYLAGVSARGGNLIGRTLTNNLIVAIPFVSGRGGTVDRIGFRMNVAGAADSKARVGIYTNVSDTDLYPDQLVVDGGEQVTNVGTILASTISVVLNPNSLYWFVFNCTIGSGAGDILVPQNQAPILGFDSSLSIGGFLSLEGTRAYAALPATFPSGIAPNGDGTKVFPAIAVRYSA